MRSTRFLQLLALVMFVSCSGCTSYLAFSRLAVRPAAEKAAREFLARIDSPTPARAYELMTRSARAGQTLSRFLAGVQEKAVALTNIQSLELAGHEISGVSAVSLKGTLTYPSGLTGDVQLALAREDGAWRVAAFDAGSPVQVTRQKEDARRAAEGFLDALRGGDYDALVKTLAPATVKRVGEARLRTLQKTFSARVEDARFVETRTKVDHPRYELFGSIRVEDGPPHDVHVVATWNRGAFPVTDFRIEPAPGWIAEQRLVARQVAVNFAHGLRSGSTEDVLAICHPALVKSIGQEKLVQLATQAPQKLAGVTFDDARSTFRHPFYELVGMQQTLAGPQLPASVKVQYVSGRYWVTGFQFD